MKPQNNISCCCDQAFSGCDKECPKGLFLQPENIFQIMNWPRRKLSYVEKPKQKDKGVIE